VADGGSLMRLLQSKYARLTWQEVDNALDGDGMDFVVG
jgi:hypothetical protein